MHCSLIASSPAALLAPPTLPPQLAAADAEHLLPPSCLGPVHPSDSILVTAAPCSLPSPCSLYRGAGTSCISTKGKGKGQAQQDGQCLLPLVPIAEGGLNVAAASAQHMLGSSQSCLTFPRPSGAVATASPPPALPSSCHPAWP